jgi:hypothetical protein
MPHRQRAGAITTDPNNVRPGCDKYQMYFPSVYGDGRSHARFDNGPTDISHDYEDNNGYDITPQGSWGLYDYNSDFHQFTYSTTDRKITRR